LRKSQYFSF